MSCEEVCIDMDFGAYIEFFNSSIVTARKEHECLECGRTIQPGEKYERAGGKCEGEFWSAAVCLECEEIAKAVVCGFRAYGYLWEGINNEVFPEWAQVGPYECLAKIESKAARDRLAVAFRESVRGKTTGEGTQ